MNKYNKINVLTVDFVVEHEKFIKWIKNKKKNNSKMPLIKT